VTDAAILLTALAGPDPADPATRDAASHATDYTRFLDANGVRGARLGVVRKLAGFSRHVDKVFADALAALQHLGAEIVDPVEIDTIGKFDDAETQVLLFEFKAGLNRYLAEWAPGAPIRSLKDAIAFNEKNSARELPYFGQELMEKAEAKNGLASAEYQKYLADCRWLSRGSGIDAAVDKLKLDALIAPTDSPAWVTDFVNGDHFSGSSSTLPAVAGYPHVTVPMGFCFGMPVGISFFGRAWSEPALIKFAYAFEQAIKARKPPRFLAHVEV
jgi:amidase